MPAVLNWIVLLAPDGTTPVSNTPVSDVAVWFTGSRFIQVTLSPMLMVTPAGENAKFAMVTLWLAPSATAGRSTALATTLATTVRNVPFRRIR